MSDAIDLCEMCEKPEPLVDGRDCADCAEIRRWLDEGEAPRNAMARAGFQVIGAADRGEES